MFSILGLVSFVISLILLIAVYFVYTYVLKPYLLIQFYKKQGIETTFKPIVGDSAEHYENIDKHDDFFYSEKQKALQNPKPRAWATTMGDTVLVFLKDPELIKTWYLKQEQYYQKHIPTIVLLKELGGDGIIFAEGAVWKKHRKLASAAFNFEFLKEMVPEVIEIADEFLDNLKKKDLSKFDMLQDIQLLTGEIVGRIFFGDNFSQYHIDGVTITQCLVDLLAEAGLENLEPHTMFLSRPLIKMGILPSHRRILKKIKAFRAVIKNIAMKKLEELEKTGKEETGKRKRINLMELFHKQRLANPADAFSEDELVSEFINFFIAGTDTAGHVLTMATYFLLKNPQYKERVFKEVDSLLSDVSKVTVDALNKMDLVTAWMKETLRMVPIGGTLFPRVAMEDNNLGGLMIKKGTPVTVSFLSNYFDPDFHTDPYTFMPERWLEEGKTKKSVSENSFVYTPFSAATRNCMGQHLAMNEVRIIFSLFLRKFNYELSDKDYKLRLIERFAYEPVEPILYHLQAK